MSIIKFSLVICSLSLMLFSTVQGQKADIMNFVPVSPNAAALGKFGNTPVNYYTGVPSIEVPIYDIEVSGLKIPVKLSYHAGGIRVSEIASWVGLGWALGGGVVIRNERGLADDLDSKGYLRHGKTIDPASLNIRDYYHAGKGWLDLESDEYVFNFPGGSGRFVLDQQANPIVVPYQRIKIEPIDQNGSVYHTGNFAQMLSGWRITNTDGVQYFFQSAEETMYMDRIVNNWHITAWNLTKIVSADKSETIIFKYEDAGATVNMPVSQTRKIAKFPPTCGSEFGSPSSPYSQSIFLGSKRLRKIEFSSGYIDFFPKVAQRCDLPGERALDKVTVHNTNGTLIKEVHFKYGYMEGNSILPQEEVTCNSNISRLMLLSVEERGKSPFKFEYIHDKGLPSSFSGAQDHWGFHNREHHDLLSLIPSGFKPELGVFLGQEREANIAYGKQGAMRRITYPTGGTTEFEYSAHAVNLATLNAFPEFSGSFDIQTIPERTFDVDYGYHDRIIASFTVNYLHTGTGISIATENFIEASGSYLTIVNSENQEMILTSTTREGNKRFYSSGRLPNGEYRIVAMREIHPVDQPTGQTYSLTIGEYQNVTRRSSPSLLTIGGLRINKITDRDPVTGNIQTKEFEYIGGRLTWGIKYSSLLKEYLCYSLNDTETSFISYSIGEFYVLTSSSNYPLSNTQGSPVGYQSVVMTDCFVDPDGTKTENGRTVFEFTTSTEYPDEGFPSYYLSGTIITEPPLTGVQGMYGDNTSSHIFYQFPHTPPRNNDWKRGLLKSKTESKRNDDGTYTVVRREDNIYRVSAVERDVKGVKVGLIMDPNIVIDELIEKRPFGGPLDEVAFSYYDTNGEYIYLGMSVEDTFDDLGSRVRTTTTYHYDNIDHLLPTRVEKTVNAGDKIITVTTYPADYLPGTPSIDQLIGANNISAPIEIVTYKQKNDGTAKLMEGMLVGYLDGGTGLKGNIKILEDIGAVEIDAFKFSSRAIAGVVPDNTSPKAAFSPDARYAERVKFIQYENGKLLEQQKVNDVVHSYLWGYSGQYPIAHAENALHNDIAYTSFEADGHGNWTVNGGVVNSDFFVTGTKSYSLSSGNSITRTNITPGSYLVTYWSRGGALNVNGSTGTMGATKNGWTYYEHLLNNVASVSINGTATIDELRLCPVNARMTTYTYDPLVGVTAISDPNGNTMYYDYDNAGRLVGARDSNGDVVKKYKYHYVE